MAASDDPDIPPIDTTTPHSARMWNYWLGGKDNYEADRQVARQMAERYPDLIAVARHSRAFLVRVVTHLARDLGMRQFLDLGTGIPTAENTHQIAQREAPEAHVVYVDNDPLVLAHARALMTSTPQGATAYVYADLRDPATVLRKAAGTLDLTRPVAVTIMSTLGHVEETSEAIEVVHGYMDRLVSGSYFAFCDTLTTPRVLQANEEYAASGTQPYRSRTLEEFHALVAGLDLLPPGIVPIPHWHADHPDPEDSLQLGGLARKP